MDPKTNPIIPGNRPDYPAQGWLEMTVKPSRIIAPIYPENICRTIICTAIAQILDPDILFWPITIAEVALMKEECEEHEDWLMMDLDNSVEKLIARLWKQFNSAYFINLRAASEIALKLGREMDKECTVANSVFINMLYSAYTDLVRNGDIYATNSAALRLRNVIDDPDHVRQKMSEQVLDLAKSIQPIIDKYIRSVNSDFIAIEAAKHQIRKAHDEGRNWVAFDKYFPIQGEALRMLISDKDIEWVIQAVPTCWGTKHALLFPVGANKGIGLPVNKKKYNEWIESSHDIIRADPKQDGIEFISKEAAIDGIATLENELFQK